MLDITIIAKHSDAMEPILYRAGYRYKGAYNLPMRKLYGKEQAYEVYWHAYEAGNNEISLKVIFRDYLNSPSEAREAYFTLKKAICPRRTASAQ
ncbi:GrpB family protein [unidentified bacterial endosymbiont]|uniref:GrpB family protein n=1 Tax=unidentified bacterial endosymbiont TaxID=2355 RepID=UPI00344BC75B